MKAIDAHRVFLTRRGPEVGWNGIVLLRELRTQGFTGGYQQVQRALQPLRTTRRWAARATVRFETGPGEQAQVDFGQLQVWIADVATPVHFFVFTLGFSRRAVAYAYRNERLDTLLDGHERALRHFGGVPLTLPLRQSAHDHAGPVGRPGAVASALRGLRAVLRLHPARLSAVSRAHQGQSRERGEIREAQCAGGPPLSPLGRAGGVARGMGRDRVADLRVHGTTHERPIDRFARETLTPLGASRRITTPRPGDASSPPMPRGLGG